MRRGPAREQEGAIVPFWTQLQSMEEQGLRKGRFWLGLAEVTTMSVMNVSPEMLFPFPSLY